MHPGSPRLGPKCQGLSSPAHFPALGLRLGLCVCRGVSPGWGQGWALGSAGGGGQREEVREAGHMGHQAGKLLSAAGSRGGGDGPQAHRQRDMEGGAVKPARAVSLPIKASKSEPPCSLLPPPSPLSGLKVPRAHSPSTLRESSVSPQKCGPLIGPEQLAAGDGENVSQC